jgi:cytoskeletal protein CcmA (bactofilin family)
MSEKQLGELSLIGPGTVIEGKIRTDGSVRVDGRLVGDLLAKGNASVGGNGSIEGNLTGKTVTIGGKVTGAIVASEKLLLEAKSAVKGDIRAAKLVVEEGAVFDGHCAMTTPVPSGRGGAQRE